MPLSQRFPLFSSFYLSVPTPTQIYTLSLHDALPIYLQDPAGPDEAGLGKPRTVGLRTVLVELDRKSTRLNSSHLVSSYAVFCLKKKRSTKLLNTSINSATSVAISIKPSLPTLDI